MNVDVASVPSVPRSGENRAFKIVAVVARVLLGLVFLAAGASGFVFLFMSPPPAPPGLASTFEEVFYRSHWEQFVGGVQLLAGVLLLVNRYVPLALILLGAVIANILVFHVTMAPQAIAIPLVVLALWLVLAWHHRSSLAPLFVQKTTLD